MGHALVVKRQKKAKGQAGFLGFWNIWDDEVEDPGGEISNRQNLALYQTFRRFEK